MKVRILKTDDRLGIKEGELYDAQPHWLDPQEKMTLYRVNDPVCNLYYSERGVFWEKVTEMPCSHCKKMLKIDPKGPDPLALWCNNACSEAYYAAHPEEAAKWIKVEDLNFMQRAELDALIGKGFAC